MSRPVGNKFADFFPNAPSVIQQRKSSKAVDQLKTRADEPNDVSSHAPPKESASRPAPSPRGSVATPSVKHIDSGKVNGGPSNQEEHDNFSGDLLNGVGSASSTSTASSVFSATNANSAMSLANGSHLHTLTPLTNSDASPRGKMMSPS